MKIIDNILRKLNNSLEYYHETRDVDDLISDISDIITEITIECLE